MKNYLIFIISLVVLVFLAFRFVKWLKDQTRLRGERRAAETSLMLAREQAYKTERRLGSREPSGVFGEEQTLNHATETGMRSRVSATIRPEERKVPPVESTRQQTEAPAQGTETELRKAPSSSQSRLFQDSDDLRKAVVWAEVLRRPVPRKLR